ncbi:trinucleotide repeat-containing gene 6A protein [Sceloporus undulatus]|uniref:trinucleotide repeat-containing gene 6A protein n=1 Tax=Sceloporus undulatus TaxID=8520 RepID=UPI001C4ABCC4|nr:trinucleotide repeat-containing gene 6A protein [Sceloporus undulatus]
MEERKKRKDEKRKKEAAQKKTAEQKNKAPELSKPIISQPLPVASTAACPSPAPCSSVGGSNNAKRALGNSQQQVQQQQQPPAQQPSLPRYAAREVPPRFRQQEQKQLLKRGQPLPGIAANLGPTSKPLKSGGNPGTGEQPAAADEGQNSSRKQPDLDHSTLGSHYESSQWGTISSSSDSITNWDKVLVEGAGKEAWPSIGGSDSELASKHVDADSALSSGSDWNLLIMASRGLGSEANGLRSGSQSKFVNGSNSNNMGKGSLSRSSWGSSWAGLQENGALANTCPVSADVSNGLAEIGNSRADAWGTLGPSHGELNPSTLNSNSHRGAWPVLENSRHALKGPRGNSSCSPAVGLMANPQSLNSASLGSSWGGLQENDDFQANGTQRALCGGQPQNPIPEVDGPNNNTTNFVISSLPNPASSMQMNELASNNNNNNTGTGTWGMSAKSSRPQASPVLNGTSMPHLNGVGSEAKTGSPPGTLWGGSYSPSYSGEACPNSSSQANSDTVNATLIMPPGLGGPSNSKPDIGREKGPGTWEVPGVGSPRSAPWERGLTVDPGGGGGRGQKGPAQAVDGEWNQLPSKQHASDSLIDNGKEFTSTWKSVEEEKSANVNLASFPVAHLIEQNGGWAKASAGSSEGSAELPEDKSCVDGASRERRKVDPQALLQSIVNRADLDPRVLCNAGWGQTPIKQNTTWDTELSPRGERKTNNGTEAWGNCGGQAGGSGVAAAPVERPGLNSNNAPSGGSRWGEPKSVTRWVDSKASGSQGAWGEERATVTLAKGNQVWGNGKEEQSSAWSEAEKLKQGWGNGQKGNLGWGAAAAAAAPAVDGWGENSRSSHWGEMRKSSSGSSDSDRSTSGWKETGKGNTAHWSGGHKSAPATKASSHCSGWEEATKPSQSQGWGEVPKPNHPQGWGEAPKSPSSPDWNKPQDIGRWGADTAATAGKPSGWLGGPAPVPEEEPTGWEEPSPESIRRKIEIDDGTSAWGDPSKYNYKHVNMWNNNTLNSGASLLDQQAQRQQQGMTLPGAASITESGASGISSGVSGWGETPAPPTTVDNGTSAWGKPVDTGTSWGESISNAVSTDSWGNTSVGRQASNKPGPKSMQAPDGRCGGNMPLARSHQAGWEEEEDVEIGMWNSSSTQEANASLHWPPCSKKLPSKGTMKNGNKQEEMWVNPFVKQFANLGFPRDSPEEMMQSNKMEISGGILPDKWMEMEKHNLNVTEYSRVIGKGPHSRPQISKESSMDRNPYFDKDGLVVAADDSQNVQFMSNQSTKFPPSNSALPNHALSSLTGLSAQSLNSVRQNGNPSSFGNLAAQSRNLPPSPAQQSLSSSQPNPRSQVPPLPSPQVPVSLLKYAPNNGGLNPLLGAQQVAMLSQLSQLNQLSQLQRFLVQQKKAQNQRNMPSGGRQQQEQQSRSLSMQQQMMQQSCQLDPNLLLKQQQQLHPSAMKSFLESVVPHANTELQKGPSQISAFSNFPIGSNSNLNVNMDMGSIKEPQSRLSKWTTVDSISTNTSLDQNASKNGAISSGFRLEETSFVPYDFMNSSNSPASPPGPIGDGWSRAKSPNSSSSVNWPPEFRPGEPWIGYPNIDPETDPYITPGSVTNNLSVNTVREADHLRDRNSGSSSSLNTTLPSTSAWSSIRASNYNVSLSSTAQSTSSARNSDSKPTWSPASINTSLAHELWKVPLPPKSIAAPSRPPPGLTGQKLPLSSWENSVRLGGGWSSSDARYTPGSTWGEGSSGRITNCLVLKNLTPQIDGSTLRTLCMQHGPLITFHLNLPHGNALVRYSSKEEVVKAQKSLHMCVLGNTTILAEFASEEEISRFFAQGQSLTPSPAWQSLGTSQGRLGGSVDSAHSFSHRSNLTNHWNGTGLSGAGGGGDLHSSTSLWGGPSYSTSLWGSLGVGGGDTRGLSSPSALNVFLSVDHLGAVAAEESM